jgi:hypothetical protein
MQACTLARPHKALTIPADVGILGMEVYVPQRYVDQEALEVADRVGSGKYRTGGSPAQAATGTRGAVVLPDDARTARFSASVSCAPSHPPSALCALLGLSVCVCRSWADQDGVLWRQVREWRCC